MTQVPILIISLSARARKAIKDIVESRGVKYRAILQDETYKGAVDIYLKNPRAVIIDGQMRADRDPTALIRMLRESRPDIPAIFFDEYAHVNLEAKKAGAVKTLSRPRPDDEAWMEWWGAELMEALEKAVP